MCTGAICFSADAYIQVSTASPVCAWTPEFDARLGCNSVELLQVSLYRTTWYVRLRPMKSRIGCLTARGRLGFVSEPVWVRVCLQRVLFDLVASPISFTSCYDMAGGSRAAVICIAVFRICLMQESSRQDFEFFWFGDKEPIVSRMW